VARGHPMSPPTTRLQKQNCKPTDPKQLSASTQSSLQFLPEKRLVANRKNPVIRAIAQEWSEYEDDGDLFCILTYVSHVQPTKVLVCKPRTCLDSRDFRKLSARGLSFVGQDALETGVKVQCEEPHSWFARMAMGR
jgi:hypothetical protein